MNDQEQKMAIFLLRQVRKMIKMHFVTRNWHKELDQQIADFIKKIEK